MTTPKSEKAKMLAGELYLANDPELRTDYLRAQGVLAQFNATPADADSQRRELLGSLFASFGPDSIVLPALRCDYGYNIRIGRNTFINYDCTLLDCGVIDIGDEVQIAPGVHIYTAAHPLDAATRRAGPEFAAAVRIADGVWIGGRAVICPGVNIGQNSVIGAGSVVTRDIPADVLAVGNPCRVVRAVPRH